MALNLPDLKVYNTEIQTGVTEVLRENTSVFNEASLGGIILTSSADRGNFKKSALFKQTDLVQERDAAATTGTLNSAKIQQIEQVGVKFDLATYFDITPDHLIRAGSSAAQYLAAVSVQVAKEMFQAYVDRSVAPILAAATKANSPVALDISAASGATPTAANQISWRALMKAASLFGDANRDIVCWVMSSAAFFNLLDNNLANQESLFTFGNVNVYRDPMGRPIIVTDNANLSDGDKGFAIGLSEGAAVIEEQSNVRNSATVEIVNAADAIKYQHRTDFSSFLSLKGFSWAPATTIISPTLVELGTAANWTRYATSHKDLCGVVLKFDYK